MSVLSKLVSQAESLVKTIEEEVESFVTTDKSELLVKAKFVLTQLQAEVNELEQPAPAKEGDAPAAPVTPTGEEVHTATDETQPAPLETPAESPKVGEATQGEDVDKGSNAPGVQTSSDLNG